MAPKKKVKTHPQAVLKRINDALSRQAERNVLSGNTILKQFCAFKEKLDSSSSEDWKKRIQPSEEDMQKLIGSKAEIRALEAKNEVPKEKNKEKYVEAKAQYSLTRKSKVSSRKSFEETKSRSQSFGSSFSDYVDIAGLANNPPLKCLSFLLRNFGTQNFDDMINRKSQYQLRDSNKVFTSLEITSSGVSVKLNKFHPKAIVASTRFLLPDDLNSMKGSLLVMDPSTNTFGTIATLNFQYQNYETGEAVDSTAKLFSDGVSFGMTLAVPSTGFPANSEAVRLLPGWDHCQPLWFPSCNVQCSYKIDVAESLLQVQSLNGIEVRFLLIPCASYQSAQRLVQTVLTDHIKTTLKSRIMALSACHGIPALNIAAFSGNRQVAKILLTNGADPNAADNYNGSTALHEAVLGRNLSLVQLLLAKGAVQTMKNSLGQTPLHIACLLGDIAVIKALCRSPLAKKAAQTFDKTGKKPNELCRSSYSRSVLEMIMKDSGLVVRPSVRMGIV